MDFKRKTCYYCEHWIYNRYLIETYGYRWGLCGRKDSRFYAVFDTHDFDLYIHRDFGCIFFKDRGNNLVKVVPRNKY